MPLLRSPHAPLSFVQHMSPISFVLLPSFSLTPFPSFGPHPVSPSFNACPPQSHSRLPPWFNIFFSFFFFLNPHPVSHIDTLSLFSVQPLPPLSFLPPPPPSPWFNPPPRSLSFTPDPNSLPDSTPFSPSFVHPLPAVSS